MVKNIKRYRRDLEREGNPLAEKSGEGIAAWYIQTSMNIGFVKNTLNTKVNTSLVDPLFQVVTST